MITKARVLKLFMFALFTFNPGGLFAGTNRFEVSGHVEMIAFRNGIAQEPNKSTFSVTVTESNSFIHASAGSRDRGIEYSEFATVGPNGYFMSKYLKRSSA